MTAIEAVPSPASHESASVGTPSRVSASSVAIAVALIVPWLLPLLAQTVPTFYKEWLFVLALGFAGLLTKPRVPEGGARVRADPLVLVALAAAAVVLLQVLVYDAVWRRGVLTIFCAAFFIFSFAIGRHVRETRADSLALIAKCLLAAALGSCALALAQLALPGLPFVLPRVGPRLFGNVGQANHFCDLLWIGCVAAAYLYARGSLRPAPALALVVVLQTFSTASGSRTAWVYAAALALLAIVYWLRRPAPQSRRFAGALMVLVSL